ncbi:hypothetical protein UMZ34_19020 [Halopseudomonas pachastrellae]|nr:hypothetical protein UMZ34_19020 [Halopseudomonas pachastrellae]
MSANLASAQSSAFSLVESLHPQHQQLQPVMQYLQLDCPQLHACCWAPCCA